MQNNDLRAELIRQFPAEVVEMRDGQNEAYYACPTCSRAVSLGMDKCICNQALSWKNIQQAEEAEGGRRKAIIAGNALSLILERMVGITYMNVR